MQRVEAFESGGAAVWPALWLPLRSKWFLCAAPSVAPFYGPGPILSPHRSSESFLLFSAFPQVDFPAVPATKSAVEEVIALLAGDFETDESEAFARDNGFLTLAANDDCPESHRSPPHLCLLFLVGQLVSQCFQISVGLL